MYSIVIGATGGIGSAVALKLASAGQNLYLIGKNREKLDNIFANAKSKEGNVEVRKRELNLENIKGVKETITSINREKIKINSLIYAAGISIGEDIFGLSEEDWDLDLLINLKVPFLFSQFAVNKMKDEGGGNIINISSYSQGNRIGLE